MGRGRMGAAGRDGVAGSHLRVQGQLTTSRGAARSRRPGDAQRLHTMSSCPPACHCQPPSCNDWHFILHSALRTATCRGREGRGEPEAGTGRGALASLGAGVEGGRTMGCHAVRCTAGGQVGSMCRCVCGIGRGWVQPTGYAAVRAGSRGCKGNQRAERSTGRTSSAQRWLACRAPQTHVPLYAAGSTAA